MLVIQHRNSHLQVLYAARWSNLIMNITYPTILQSTHSCFFLIKHREKLSCELQQLQWEPHSNRKVYCNQCGFIWAGKTAWRNICLIWTFSFGFVFSTVTEVRWGQQQLPSANTSTLSIKTLHLKTLLFTYLPEYYCYKKLWNRHSNHIRFGSTKWVTEHREIQQCWIIKNTANLSLRSYWISAFGSLCPANTIKPRYILNIKNKIRAAH